MDAHGDNCAFEHIFTVMAGETSDPAVVAKPVPASSCDQQPSEAKINLMVSFLLEGAEEKCTATEVEQVTSTPQHYLQNAPVHGNDSLR